LRIAAGIEAPDRGMVRLRGRPLPVGGGVVAGAIAYCQPRLRSPEGQIVLDELIAAQLALGVRPAGARARAEEALERAGATHCQGRRPYELDRGEAVSVAIARALLQEPSLLIIDEPTTAVDLLKRDEILQLLRALSRERMGVLISVDKGTSLVAADRALSLGEGELRGHLAPELAPIVQLRASG
jgi:energy-coupling factor transporter ATP-binding protein EcfA2